MYNVGTKHYEEMTVREDPVPLEIRKIRRTQVDRCRDSLRAPLSLSVRGRQRKGIKSQHQQDQQQLAKASRLFVGRDKS